MISTTRARDLIPDVVAATGVAAAFTFGSAGGFEHTVRVARLNGAGNYWDIVCAVCVEVLAMTGTAMWVAFHRRDWPTRWPLALVVLGVLLTFGAQMAYRAAPLPNVVLGYVVAGIPTTVALLLILVAHLAHGYAAATPTASAAGPGSAATQVTALTPTATEVQPPPSAAVTPAETLDPLTASTMQPQPQDPAAPTLPATDSTPIAATKTEVEAPATAEPVQLRTAGRKRDVTKIVQAIQAEPYGWTKPDGSWAQNKIEKADWSGIGEEKLSQRTAREVVERLRNEAEGRGGEEGGSGSRKEGGKRSTPLHHDRDGSEPLVPSAPEELPLRLVGRP